MSHSPASRNELKLARAADSTYRLNLQRVNELTKRGASLSGHERNCAFLNLKGKSFATISAVSGFDFTDDGRGLATTDWDADGDVDVWVTSRTAPRIRFLRNELPGDRCYLSLRLVGTTCNRDAIGARVAVHLENADQPLIKTLRAGEGYLSQSSKWLHFGLGKAEASITHVVVKWPGGETQVCNALQKNHRYVIEQGARPRRVNNRTTVTALNPSPQPVEDVTHVARIPLISRIPAPRLPFLTTDGSEASDAVDVAGGKPLLITLWASWCGQCRAELAELARHARQIDQVGIRVLALNTDQSIVDSQLSGDPNEVLQQVDWPQGTESLRAGSATDELVRRLRLLHDLPLGRQVTMPVPISFLLDAEGELAIVYRGRTSVEQVLKDVGNLTSDAGEWRSLALPLLGRWNMEPKATDLLSIPRQLLDRKQTEDALWYVRRHEQRLADNEKFPTLRAWLGDQLIELNRAAEGRAQYEAALQAAPGDVTLMNNVAWLLATHPDASIRDGEVAVQWSERAVRATRLKVPGLLDTLAASYAEIGDFRKALQAVALATKLAKEAQDMEFVEKMRGRLVLYEQGRPFRQPAPSP